MIIIKNTISSPDFDWSNIPGLTKSGDINLNTFMNDPRIARYAEFLQNPERISYNLFGQFIDTDELKSDEDIYFNSIIEDNKMSIIARGAENIEKFVTTLSILFPNHTFNLFSQKEFTMEDFGIADYTVLDFHIWKNGVHVPIVTDKQLYLQMFPDYTSDIIYQHDIKVNQIDDLPF